MTKLGVKTKYTAGSTLLGEGEETDFVLLILKGYAKVVTGTPRRIITIAGPCEVVGEMSVIRHKPRFASVFAITEVEALYLAGSRWLEFLYEHPRAMHGLLYMVDERLEAVARRSVESYLGAEQKVARALMELESKGLGDVTPDGLSLRFSQQELADLAGVSRESISQVVRLFKKRNFVRTGRQVMTLLDIETLRAVADGDVTASE